MEIANVLKSKLKFSKNKLLKDDRKLKQSRFTAGKLLTIGFWTVTAGVIFLSFQAYMRTGFLNEKVNGLKDSTAAQIENFNKASFVTSPAGEDYSKRFAVAYMNVPSDQPGRDTRAQKLQKFFAEGLALDKVENLSEFKGKRVLKDIQLYGVKDVTEKTAVYQYRVSYDVVNIEDQAVPADPQAADSQPKTVQKESDPVRKEALLLVPLATDGVSFNVIEQPYFETLPVGSRLAAVEDRSDRAKQNFKAEEELKQFTTQFFTSYTENTVDEMAYLMKEPGSLKGLYQFKGLEDFVVYNGKKGEFMIKSLVVLKDTNSGLTVKQPVTLTVSKQNGKFFVEKIKHTIGG